MDTTNALEFSVPNKMSLLERKKRSTPQEYATHLHSMGPLFYWEPGRFWVVTTHDLGKAALKNPDLSADRSAFFVSRMPNLDLRLIQDFFGVIGKMMVMSDGDQHAMRRRIASMGVTDELLEHYRPWIDTTVAKLLDRVAHQPHFDFVSEIAEILPSVVLADLFCIPEDERPNFYRWSNNMTQFFGGASQYRNEDGIEVNQSARNIRSYFEALLQERKARPLNDFLSVLLQNQKQFGLDDSEIIAQAIMMLVAGQITTTDQLCNNMFALLTESGALTTLQALPEVLPSAIEEFNRLDPAVSYLFRVAKADTTLLNTTIKAGETVFISNHAVNRDPLAFANPDACVLTRSPNVHFAYGHGSHYCLGARLARLQMLACLGQILKRFPNMQLHPELTPLRKHHSLAFSGFEKLIVRTTA